VNSRCLPEPDEPVNIPCEPVILAENEASEPSYDDYVVNSGWVLDEILRLSYEYDGAHKGGRGVKVKTRERTGAGIFV